MPLTQVQPGMLGAPQPYNFKNRLINGAMVIDQRNAGAATTVNTNAALTYTLDRWFGFGQATDGVFTVQQSTVAPAGFVNSLLVTVTTADTSIGAGQTYNVGQYIEGFNTADLNWGTANAKTITLSFWVRSSITGTFGGSIRSAANRSYPFSYTINSANTWEYERITIPGDTTGTWATGNTSGPQVWLSLGTGSTLSGATGSWQTGNLVSATGATSIMGTNGATFYITGCQFEVGVTATDFDYRPYGTELALCQRYAFIISGRSGISDPFSRYMTFGSSSTSSLWFPTFPVQMRIPPSLLTKSFNDTTVDFYNYNTTVTPGFTSVVIAEGDVFHAQVGMNYSSGSAAGNLISWRWKSNPDAYIGFNAEL